MNFERQIAYNNWANSLILEAIAVSSETRKDPELLKQLGHLIHVQIEWYNRVMKVDKNTIIWPELSFKECEELLLESPGGLNELIPKADEICNYQNSKGISYKTKVSDILQHVIIHGQHHRAQIALLLRQKGIDPPGTDYIYFTRLD